VQELAGRDEPVSEPRKKKDVATGNASGRRWEYKIYDTVDGVNPDCEQEMDGLGSHGWELVAIRKSDSPYGGWRYYFKRQA
jgi:hypothetical protein